MIKYLFILNFWKFLIKERLLFTLFFLFFITYGIIISISDKIYLFTILMIVIKITVFYNLLTSYDIYISNKSSSSK